MAQPDPFGRLLRTGAIGMALLATVIAGSFSTTSVGAATKRSTGHGTKRTRAPNAPKKAPPTTTTTTAPSGVGGTASGLVTDSAGDRALISLTVGKPVVAASVQDQRVKACASAVSDSGSSLSRSVAIPITLTMTVQSSSPATVLINMLTGTSFAENAGPGTDKTNGHWLWATTYSGQGPECTPTSTGDGGTWATVVFRNSKPGTVATWASYLVTTEAVTPASGLPTSPSNPDSTLLFDPYVALEATGITGSPLTFTSGASNLVSCVSPQTEFETTPTVDLPYLPLNMTGAEAHGCTGE